MTPAEVISLIKEKDVKFIDFRFTDTKGKEHHVTIPARLADDDLFEEYRPSSRPRSPRRSL
ncbi:MAG: hypothetical protein ACE1Y4_04215, partial [Lysobacterales bacterium]